MVFNALINNDDDHPRNHGVFAAPGGWALSPLYDVPPAASVSHEVRLAMIIGEGGRQADIANLVSVSPRFGVAKEEAQSLISTMAAIVGGKWEEALIARDVSTTDRIRLAGSFLKPGLGLKAREDNSDGPAPTRNGPRRSKARNRPFD